MDNLVSAMLGKFDLNLRPLDVLDVSDFISKFAFEGGICVPSNIKSIIDGAGLKCHSGDYLQVAYEGRRHHILVDNYIEDIVVRPADLRRIKLVYGVYVNPSSNWRSIIAGQLYDLKRFGLLDEADLHVVITNPNRVRGVGDLIGDICDDVASITSHHINRYEYWAIDKIWRLAQENPTSTIAYLHTKGMSYNIVERLKLERIVTEKTFRRWRMVEQLLGKSGVEKAGLFPSPHGWIWYNFWFATGKYLSRCEAPEFPSDERSRYYYESWLYTGERNARGQDCYSQWTAEVGKTFMSKEAELAVHSLCGAI